MNQLFKQKTAGKPRILVAPLDWGLGHATRSIPVIREFLAQGCEVYLAGTGKQAALLQAEFPGLTLIPLEGYNIKYARTVFGQVRVILFQIPKIIKTIRREHKWLLARSREFDFDAVISDNRYGLYHTSIPCVFITHQLAIKSRMGKWTERILQKRNYTYINHFTECWVPDDAGENNLAGELSHPLSKPAIPLKYLGSLSRFEIKGNDEKKNHLLVILSGPEPQRTMLEEKIINGISHYNYTATIVRGLPEAESIIPSTEMLKFYNHLPAEDLNKAMMEAEYVIGRSGYSSIMDIVALQKKSILIPTPGQPEQEYLGKYLAKKNLVVCVEQDGFILDEALEIAQNTRYLFPGTGRNNLLKKIVEQFLRQFCPVDLG